MLCRITPIAAFLLALVFLGDVVNADVLFASRTTKTVQHHSCPARGRHAGTPTVRHTGTQRIAAAAETQQMQDEDSPTVVDTDLHAAPVGYVSLPDTPPASEPRDARPSFLSLCTLLI